jgi:hypothetical protein
MNETAQNISQKAYSSMQVQVPQLLQEMATSAAGKWLSFSPFSANDYLFCKWVMKLIIYLLYCRNAPKSEVTFDVSQSFIAALFTAIEK